jgi:hypothetical protein
MATVCADAIEPHYLLRFQIAATLEPNCLDRFDASAIISTSPGIVSDWGIDRAALCFIFST